MIYHNKYFLQTRIWADFWKENNPSPHDYYEIESKNSIIINAINGEPRELQLATLIYQFPWEFGQRFWYIPKGFWAMIGDEQIEWNQVDVEDLEVLFVNFLRQIFELAKQKGVVFVKIDLEEGLTHWLNIESKEDLSKFLEHYLPYRANLKTKIIQYLRTITLDLQLVDGGKVKDDLELDKLESFYKNSQEFWATTNQNVRRYTKKSLSLNWQISTDKTIENFEAFWEIYNYTKDRHGFVIQERDYLQSLYSKDYSRIIVLRQDGKVHGVWFGIVVNGTLTYLYGGNDEVSFDNYGQYLIHLVAVQIAVREGVNYYDLGGYDDTKGFGKFKEGYRGQLRNFLGPVDIVIDPLKYSVINPIIKLVKALKGKK
jgi:lipid II:glycine glycyltransferase (peptidoglycan interpeptide bridge formation enzyme)